MNHRTMEDTREQKRATAIHNRQIQELGKIKERLSQAQRIARIGNWELDLTTNTLWWSGEIFQLFEIDQDKFGATYEGFLNAIHPEDRDEVNRAYTESLQTRTPYDIVHRLLMNNGRIKHVHERCESYFDEAGNPLKSVGTVQDITEHFQIQEALKKSEQRLALLLNTLPHGIQENDTRGIITYANIAQHNILGYKPDELIGKYIWDFQLDDKRKRELRDYLAYLVEAQPAPEPYITYNHTADGRKVILEVTWDYQRNDTGKVTGFISVISDITARAHAEQALTASEANLKEAQALTHMGNWDLDLATGIASWSEEEYRLLGYEPGAVEASADNFMNSVHPEDREAVQKEMQRAMRPDEKTPYHIQHQVLLPDGRIRMVEERGKVIHDEQGNPLRMFGTTQDITERVHIEKELSLHRKHLQQLVEERTATIRHQAQIIDQTHDSVITTDLDGYITSWNGGAERILGFSMSNVLGQHISILYPGSRRKFLEDKIIQPLQKKGTHEVETLLQKADGTQLLAHLSLSLIYDDDGTPVGMVGYAIDISELKKRERELEQMAERLQASNKELEAFSYSVSHDLRAPLRAIDGFSLALVEDYGDQLDETAHDYLRRVRNGAQRMGLLIDEILQLSRVSRSELVCGEVNLSEIARSVMAELQEAEPERDLQLTLEDDMLAQGDPRLLRIMLENLLGNAWKFTAREPVSQISFHRLEDDAGTFCIRDNGVGFDMRHADKLFGAFQRLHRVSDFPGTGVGLATVQRILSRHGGKIWAEARENEGAAFYFRLSTENHSDTGSSQAP